MGGSWGFSYDEDGQQGPPPDGNERLEGIWKTEKTGKGLFSFILQKISRQPVLGISPGVSAPRPRSGVVESPKQFPLPTGKGNHRLNVLA